MIETKKLRIIYRDQPLHIEYFLRRGQKNTILYLHGLGCSKHDFLGATEIESYQYHTLTAFDFPGHGGSSYSIKPDMDDLVEITNLISVKLDLYDIVLIGHSMGGLVGLLYCEKYAVNVKAFINIEGNLKSEDCIFSREAFSVDFDTFLRTTFRNFKYRLLISKKTGFIKCAETLEKFKPYNAIYDYSPSLVKYSDSGSLIEKFATLKVPKLFICGSESRGLSYIPELIQKGITVSVIKNSNHFPQYDNPKEFHAVVSSFLKKC